MTYSGMLELCVGAPGIVYCTPSRALDVLWTVFVRVCGVTSWVGVAVAIARRARGGRWTTVDGVVRACASRVCVVVRRRRSSSFAFASSRVVARDRMRRAHATTRDVTVMRTCAWPAARERTTPSVDAGAAVTRARCGWRPSRHAAWRAGTTARGTMRDDGAEGSAREATRRAARANPDAIAVVDAFGREVTYKALMRGARALASSSVLANVARGERVGLAATPGAEFCAGAYAAWTKGAVLVPIASSHSEDDAAYVMRHSGLRVVLIPPSAEGEDDVETREKYERAAKKFALDVKVAHVTKGLFESLGDGDASETDGVDVDIEPSDGALIIYTSGTTGQPKGALHTHASLYAQCAGLIEAWRWSSSDRIIHALPLHHIHGIVNAWLSAHMSGATVEFQKQFAPRAVWARLRDSTQPPATIFMGVPTMYVMLLRALQGNLSAEARAASIDAVSRLRLTVSGSAACPVPILEEWRKVTGRSLLERYGMTEIGMALSNPYDESKHKAGFVGLPLPGVDVKLAPLEASDGDQEDPGDDFALGPGELLVKGGNLFAEYFDNAEATAESFTSDGYFKTGDVAAMTSDGYWRILGRASVDVLKVGGFKVSALEIEARLLENQAVAEVAVIGIPDEAYGQRAVALVVLDRSTETGEPVNVTEGDIIQWARTRLAAKMHLRAVKFVDKIPRNAMGKVNKKDLQKTVFREYFKQ